LDIVDEVNIMVVGALLNGVLRLHTFNSEGKHGMSYLTIFDIWVEFLITVLRFNVTDFISPPHHSLPIRFVIFKEHSVVIWVFSQSNDNVLRRRVLRLLDTLKGKDLKCLSNIKNSSFFSSLVLQVDLASLGIGVFWNHIDTAFLKFE